MNKASGGDSIPAELFLILKDDAVKVLHSIYQQIWWLRQYRVCLQCGRLGFDPWVGKIPWRRKWQPTPVLLPEKSHGRRSLVGYGPWSRKELDMTGETSLVVSIIHTVLKQYRCLSSLSCMRYVYHAMRASLVAQRVKHLPTMQETWV